MKNNNEKPDPNFEPLSFSEELARTVLDAISAHIAILDDKGIILETNQAWRNFSMDSGVSADFDYKGINYLDICDAAKGEDEDIAKQVAKGIRGVIAGKIEKFSVAAQG